MSLGIDGTYIVKEDTLQSFFEDCYLRNRDDLDKLSIGDRQELFTTTGNMFPRAYIKIISLCAERYNNNYAPRLHTLPFYRIKLIIFVPRHFSIVKQNQERVEETFSSSDIVKLEDEFRGFKNHISSSESTLKELKKFEISISSSLDVFGKAWRPFAKRFKVLTEFCDRHATVFTGTETVECDFSKINLERNDYRAHLSDRSLEGILQRKKFRLLKKFNQK